MTKKEMLKWIDSATYEELMYRWRFAPASDPFFQGEVGDYYKRKLLEKKRGIPQEKQVAISKKLGWR